MNLEKPSNDLPVHQVANRTVANADFPQKNNICFAVRVILFQSTDF